MVKIKFYGAARQVTGSMHLIEKNDFKLLLDCGMQQGKRKESFERNRNFPFSPSEVNSIILSHAHIDHSGNIPTIIAKGYKGPVFCTHATKDLCDLMLPDSAYVQMKDLEYVNKKRAKQGKNLFEPLYTIEQAQESLKKFESKNIGEYFNINKEEILAYFLNAGHILGSAMVILKIIDNGREIKIGFTGDLGRKQLPIIIDPDNMYNIDYLICESTYGGRDHKPIETALDKISFIINDTYSKGGKIIIPVFTVERAQEILYILNKLFINRKIPAMLVFVDSPLAKSITEVFMKHSECFDPEMLELMANNKNPFYLELLKFTESVQESKAINDYDKPCVILSATGMCEAGRILHHLKNNIEDSRNTILIVGYQAKETLGRRLVDGEKEVKIFGELYKVNASVFVINEFSGHAGSKDLVAFIKKAKKDGRLKKIFLVHGEPEQQQILIERLNKENINNVIAPETGYEEEL
ncbi:MAG: MBL fold metallo-hydrolase [Candidatus Goldbacteria bacterium]|nr:MBL fold metallo-hydrolase [Candidatus Goldiibacteriota bacterium]